MGQYIDLSTSQLPGISLYIATGIVFFTLFSLVDISEGNDDDDSDSGGGGLMQPIT